MSKNNLQIPMFSPQTEWTPPDELKDLSQAKQIAIDLETRDPNLTTRGSGSVRGDGEIVGIAVAVEGWQGYFPIAHEGGGNIDKKIVMDWFKDVLKTPATKIFHNAMYDVSWIRAVGLKIEGKIIDTMIAGSLVNENRMRYNLDSLAREYVGMGKNEKLLFEAAKEWGVNPKKEMWRLPAMHVGEYAEQDAVATLKLWERLQQEITAQDLWDIFNTETELFPCLVDMKFQGVRVDLEKAHQVKKMLSQQEKIHLQKIKKDTGIDVEIWAAASIAKVFDKLKLPYDQTATGAPSFTKNFLSQHPNETAKAIAFARELNKAHTTFIDTILEHEHNGRIHADINQIRSDDGGTVTGRFSYSNPNLQQIPARSKKIGPLIRSLFLPEEKCLWGAFDYSQQEPRIVVHYAALSQLQGVSDIVEAYREGDADFHQAVADMADIDRKDAKTINLGLMYGMGKNKLMAELGLLVEQAEKLLKKYHERAPFVKQLIDAVSRRAQERGRIRTIGGRICHFDLWEPASFGIHKPLPHADALAEHGPGIKRAFTYKALNKLIQGSAADMTKIAMVKLYQEGIIPMIQIHDELDVSVESPEQAQKIIEVMEEAVKLEVPNKVDYEKGENWGDAK
jgi:DNA polymerase I-like protein with 3'-5' exonuclease and polymerase domains